MTLDWTMLDTWIAATGALAAMACALPGVFLVLRGQSLMGDALSHATLPGVVLAYLVLHQFEQAGWVSSATSLAVRHVVLFTGALLMGLACGIGSELLRRYGRVEAGAALGVVYVTLFAIGLLMLRLFADQIHLDPGCVLYGNLETAVTDTVGAWHVPRAAIVNGTMLLLNGLLAAIAFKELKLCTFDPDWARTTGLRVDGINLVLLGVTSATVVAAFESVGSILVVSMLVVPAATAVLLSDRLRGVIAWSLLLAAGSAVGGHAAALWMPGLVARAIGVEQIGDVSTAGMMAVVAGGLFGLAWLFAPRWGLVRRLIDLWSLRVRILGEDIVGLMYRNEELRPGHAALSSTDIAAALHLPIFFVHVASRWLVNRRWLQPAAEGWNLSDLGRQQAQTIVRSHRLWETYLTQEFGVPSERVHASAEQVEHYLNPKLREELAAELAQPEHDPHGAAIPPESK